MGQWITQDLLTHKYMSKKPHRKERTRIFNLAGKQSIVRNSVRMSLLGKKKFQDVIAYKESN